MNTNCLSAYIDIAAFDGAQFSFAYRHIIEGAVRFDVIRSHAHSRSDRLKNAKLIRHGIEDFFCAYLQFLASEIFAIKKAWMRSNRDSMLLRRRNCGVHRIGIAGVKTSCDIRRADELEQLGIVTRPFAQIGVKIDNQIHDTCKLSPMRKRSSSRSRSSKS